MSVPYDLNRIGVIDFLDADLRPTFIIKALSNAYSSGVQPVLVYINPSLSKSSAHLQSVYLFLASNDALNVTRPEPATIDEEDGRKRQATYVTISNQCWQVVSVNGQWKVLSLVEHFASMLEASGSSPTTPSELPSAPNPKSSATSRILPRSSRKDQPGLPLRIGGPQSWQWTQRISLFPLTQHQELLLSFDWAKTPLGPIQSWPSQLRQICNYILADWRPMLLWWGPTNINIYNESYVEVAGKKHPGLLGQPVEFSWPEVWPALSASIEIAKHTRRANRNGESMYILERNGFPEETYIDWSTIPILDDSGSFAGFLNPVTDTTDLRLAERRMMALINIGEACAAAHTLDDFWSSVITSLTSANEHDVPFATLYSIGDYFGANNDSQTLRRRPSECKLEGFLGVETTDAVMPSRFSINGAEKLPTVFRSAIASGGPALISCKDYDLSYGIFAGTPTRGFRERCQMAVICPISPSTSNHVLGVLVLALNTRTPYNDNYQNFISMLNQQLGTSLAATLLYQQEVERALNADARAAKAKAQLSEELIQTSQKFQALADAIPCGLALTSNFGDVTYANDVWYDMTGFPRDHHPSTHIYECICDEDLPVMQKHWQQLITTGHPVTFTFRIRSISLGGDNVWIQGSALTLKDNNHAVKSVVWVLNDVTEQKKLAEQAITRAQLAENLSAQLSIFRHMFDMAVVGMYRLDPEGRVIEANAAWHDLMGLEKDDPTLQQPYGWAKCFNPSELEEIYTLWNDLTAYEKPVQFECKLRRKRLDTSEGVSVERDVWAMSLSVPDRSINGELYIMGCLTDISAQKQAYEYALERAALFEQVLTSKAEKHSTEQRLAQFTRLAPVGLFSVNPAGEFVYVNDRWHEILGLPKRPWTWISAICEVAKIKDADLIRRSFDFMISRREPTSREFQLERNWTPPNVPGGEVRESWVSYTGVAENSESGEPVAIHGCIIDISHLKWAEEIQKRRMEEAIEARQNQERFIDVTCHEIRNPLSAVMQCVDAISEALIEARESTELAFIRSKLFLSIENADVIASCVLHQKRIVDDILTLSKIDAKLLQITPVRVDPCKVIRNALKMFDSESLRTDVKIKFELAPSFEDLGIEYLFIDPNRTLQILINLLTNAIKFTQTQKRRAITVRMGLTREPPLGDEIKVEYIKQVALREDLTLRPEWSDGLVHYLSLSVQDTGRGLDAEEKKLLFERFSQASPKTHIQYGGSGLGLFISRELTELQGGRIGVSSQAGVGSTFAFFVKVRKALAITPEKEKRASILARTQATTVNPSELTILVVEDNLVNQKVLCKQLHTLGCTVYVANHGVEALDIIKTTTFWRGAAQGVTLSVVLMDIEMPIMDGLSCTRAIRALQKQGSIVGHVPIIAVSANARGEQQAAAKAAGMDDAVTKPFRIPELMPKIGRLVGGSRG